MKLLALRRREPPSAESTPPPDPPPRSPWRQLLRLPRRPSLWNLVRHNPGLKLLALLLAFFLWFSINVTERDARRTIELPVTVRTRPAFIVTDGQRDTVEVTLSGPRTILDGVEEHKSAFTFNIDLTHASPGPVRIDPKRSMVRPLLNRRLDLVAVKPTPLIMTVGRLERRQLPVEPKLRGEPALGYRVARVTVMPPQVEVTAPGNRFESLHEISTEDLDLAGLHDDFDKTVVLGWAGESVTFTPDRVQVSVTFQQAMMSRVFAHVPVRIAHGEGVRARVTPAWVDLTIEGPQPLLHNYQLEDDAAYVDVEHLGPGRHQVSVHVNLPPELKLVRRQPDPHTVVVTSIGGKG
jgi:YbbR domain-containing protein